MKLNYLGRRASARGLTLIELVVVLAILVALAGLIIGNFPSLLRKASGSTSANTIQDIARAVSIRQTTLNSVGSGFDSLLDTSDAVFSKLPPGCLTNIVATALTTNAAALAELGLTQICRLDATTTDATWSVAASNNLVNVIGTTVAAQATPFLVNKIIPNSSAYVGTPTVWLFGVGKISTLVGAGSTLLEAPTRTGTSELENAQNFYQRYVIAFVVDGSGLGGAARARFLGALAPTALGFSLTDDATQMYNQN